MPDQEWMLNLDGSGPFWSWFDVKRYARNDATAAQAARTGAEAAVEDYIRRGEALGYGPNLFFDPVYYLALYPDVAMLIGSGLYTTAFDHYRSVGWRDRDPHWLFSVVHYRIYKDLQPETVDDLGGLYGHYLRAGAGEGRIAHPLFDAHWYAARHGGAAQYPFHHYLEALENVGPARVPEPRCSPYFDPVWYLATYADVGRAVAAGKFRGALHHYLAVGIAEGRDPLCDFSETDYRAGNPDVDAAIADGVFRNGYDHFVQFGAVHRRSPCKHIDLGWYADQPAVVRDLEAGRFPNPFLHILAVGVPEGLPLVPPVPLDFALDEAAARAAFLSQARRTLPSFGRRPLAFGYDGTPDVSVIVILRNQFALTMQSLASLRHTYAGKIQLLIIDNASNDGTTAIADMVKGAEITRLAENVGFLRACNLALQSATAPAVLFMNNDVVLHADAIVLALDRLGADASVGAVGGKIIRTHGLLQEAACLLWRDGGADGWMRDAPPDAPEANYVREVDYCSGCFLMVRGDLLRSLGGFDDGYAPAYYEETDLCLRIRARGFRVLYDPAIALTHYEYGSSRSLRAATALMLANQSTLRSRHATALRTRLNDRSRRAEAAAHASRGRRVLFLEDTVPLHRLGSGFGRSFDVLSAIVAAGWQVSMFPMHPVRSPLHQIAAEMPETVEVLWDRDHRSLGTFLAARTGYYDLVWVSRAHNLRQLLNVVGGSMAGIETAGLVLDTEAVFSMRDKARAELDGLPFDLPRALALEFEDAWQCDHVVAVNQAEAEVLRTVPLANVGIVGHPRVARPTPQPWSERQGILHVGALMVETAPNVDGLRWFMDAVHPTLETLVGREAARLTVAGFVSDGLDLSWLRDHPGVEFLGPVGDLTPLYASHRVFVAPTRFAAGVASKVLDAASRGIPIVATDLLARQLEWVDGQHILSAPVSDPTGFAMRLARLLTDEHEWAGVREAALEAVRTRFNQAQFTAEVAKAIAQGRRRIAG